MKLLNIYQQVGPSGGKRLESMLRFENRSWQIMRRKITMEIRDTSQRNRTVHGCELISGDFTVAFMYTLMPPELKLGPDVVEVATSFVCPPRNNTTMPGALGISADEHGIHKESC